MTSATDDTVRLWAGVLNPVANAHIGVMLVAPPRIRLGVVEPDGSENIAWYGDGDIIEAAGRRWRVSAITSPAESVSADDRPVAILSPLA